MRRAVVLDVGILRKHKAQKILVNGYNILETASQAVVTVLPEFFSALTRSAKQSPRCHQEAMV